MKILAILVLLSVGVSAAHAADIASCSGLHGKAYFPATGMVSPSSSGWENDKISGGLTKLVKLGANEYNIMWIDSRHQIFSTRDAGASVVLLSRAKHEFSLLVVYPTSNVDVYTFYKDNSGKLVYMLTTAKTGNKTPIDKASIMIGHCEYIHFNQL
ncbi:MAG: hypothetical protein L0H63_07130 [Nitrococcus sp.]|nr:hypothetical protein [Nitrococcus sp.]